MVFQSHCRTRPKAEGLSGLLPTRWGKPRFTLPKEEPFSTSANIGMQDFFLIFREFAQLLRPLRMLGMTVSLRGPVEREDTLTV
jgi:hypothetical protein